MIQTYEILMLSYTFIWSITIVLNFFKKLSEKMNFKSLKKFLNKLKDNT